MSDSSLSVKVTADVTGLTTQMALARAEVNAFNRTLTTAARTAQESGLTDALKTQMAAASEGLVAARSQVNALSDSLGKAGEHVGGLREINMAIRELSTGEVSRLPFTFAKLGESFGGAGLAGMGAIAGVVGLGAALVEVARSAAAAEEAVQQARVAFAWEGLPESTQQLRDMTSQLAAIPGITEKAAGETAAALATIKASTPDLLAGLVAIMPDLVEKFGTGEKAVEAFAKGWNDIQEKGGDPAAYFQRFVSGSQRIDQTFDEFRVTAKNWAESLMLGFAGVAGGAEQVAGAVDNIDVSKMQVQAAKIKAAFDSLGSATVTPKGDALTVFRLQLDQMEAASKGSHEQMLQEAVSMWQAETKAAGLSVAQQLEAETGLAEAQKSLHESEGQAAKQAYDKEVEAAKQAANKKLEAQKQADQQLQEIDKAQTDTALQLSKIKIDGERSELDAEVDAHRITAAQKLDILRDLENQEYSLDRQNLDTELKNLDIHLANYKLEYQKLFDQIEVLDAQHAQKMAQTDQQIADNQKKAAEQSGQAFQNAFVTPSEHAFDSMLQGILQGTQTWQQTVDRALSNLVATEIESDAKWLANHLLTNAGILASDKATTQGGVLAWLLGESQKTASTVSNNAVRMTSDASNHTSFLSEIGEMIAGWLGFETDKTAATVAGNAASNAAMVAAGMGEIMIDAAVGAAGAEAFFAPYGPEVSAPAAAAEYAKILGWGAGLGGGGLAQGTNFVPSDMMTLIHAGERVIPAADNADLFSALATGPQINANMPELEPIGGSFGGGGGGGGSSGGEAPINVYLNVSAVDGQSVANLFKNNGSVIANALAAQVRNSNSALRGAAR